MANGGTTIYISGPSGSGKTTTSRWYSTKLCAYLEIPDKNPHLAALLGGQGCFDAFQSQKWFLRRVTAWIEAADWRRTAFIDQDPVAIVEVYGEMFHARGLIDDMGMTELREGLRYTESLLGKWPGGCVGLFLDASPDVLYRRVLLRNGVERTPSVEWFQEVRERFAEVFDGRPGYERVDTTAMDLEELKQAVGDFVRRHGIICSI